MTRFALLGVPFDGAATLGWPGSRYAPDLVRRHLSWMTMRLEGGRIYWIDRDQVVEMGADVIEDRGNVVVVPHDLQASLDATREAVAAVVADGLVPLVVGGDDSILYPTVAGVHDAVDGDIAVVHFDAHLDLMDESPAQGRYSQSSGMRRALELERVDPGKSVQIGTRNFNFPASKAFVDEAGLTEVPARQIHDGGWQQAVEVCDAATSGAAHLVVALDIDVLDPAHAPGVGWHEPGGLSTHQLYSMLEHLASRASALCVNEVNPMTDHREQTAILAANLLFHFVAAASA